MSTSQQYCIAGHRVEIAYRGDDSSFWTLLPSFRTFLLQGGRLPSAAWPESVESPENAPMLFRMTVDDTLRPVQKDVREHIRDFDTGNGITRVDRLPDGGYQYIIRDIRGNDCCLLITDSTFADCRCALNGDFRMRTFGLNNALMLAYAFAASRRQTLLIHASLVRHEGHGYAFTAKSGTGKSTHVNLWLNHIPDCDLMNDDNPIVRILDDGKAYIFGSPWSGKTPCYRNIVAPLGALTLIERAKENRVERFQPIDAFAALLPACSTMKWDTAVFESVCQTVSHLIERIPIYVLHCLPDRDAAIVCHDTIARKQ